MTRNALARELANQHGTTIVQMEKILTSAFDLIKSEVCGGGTVFIPHFGSFTVAEKKSRTGINPATKEKIVIPAYIRPRFKASNAFKNELSESSFGKKAVKKISKKK